MKDGQNRPSIDGFTLRRRSHSSGPSGDISSHPKLRQQALQPRTLKPTATASSVPEILPRPEIVRSNGLSRADIDESLRAVEEAPVKKPKKRRFQRKKLLVSLVLLTILVGGLGYFATKVIVASGRVFSGSVFDLFGSGTPLKKDANGRTNILIFGTSEDNPGHDGASLTDSIMLVSIDQEQKTTAMVSMPRDMWVKFDTPCQFGNQGKVNIVYECAGAVDDDLSNIDEAKGSEALRAKVGEVFGFDIQYSVKVNYSVVRGVTTALGGVTVNIQSDNPKGIYDINTKLKLPNGPATLQGEQALAFVRARGGGGGYGFDGSNFAREQNQQKMLVAIRDKALSIGTLTNPVAVSNLLDALGDNIRTNFSAGEIKTLSIIGKDIPNDKITQISLNDTKKPVVTTALYNTQSIVRPVLGLLDYSGIQQYIKQQLGGGDVSTEDAKIDILNGSGKVGAASTLQTTLTQAGLLNTSTGNSAFKPTAAVVWYDLTAGSKPKTSEKLTSVLGKQSSGTKLPSGVQSTADFVIVIGSE